MSSVFQSRLPVHFHFSSLFWNQFTVFRHTHTHKTQNSSHETTFLAWSNEWPHILWNPQRSDSCALLTTEASSVLTSFTSWEKPKTGICYSKMKDYPFLLSPLGVKRILFFLSYHCDTKANQSRKGLLKLKVPGKSPSWKGSQDTWNLKQLVTLH